MSYVQKSYAFLTFVIILSSCGYSLRDNQFLVANLDSIQLQVAQPSSEFSRMLRRDLELSGVQTVLSDLSQEPNAQTEHELIVGNEEISNRPVTINSRARAAQYEMRLSIEVALKKNQTFLFEPEALFVDRIFFEDIQNITGNQEEIRIISSEMRQDLVSQVIRRIESAIN